jgi:hypothetical protein
VTQGSSVVEDVAEVNRLIDYHAPIAKALTDERTSLESRLIPVTAYIVVACGEAFFRYPELMAKIDAAMPAEEIGRRGRRPGSQVNTVFLWSIANFWLLGRKIVSAIDPSKDTPELGASVLGFWDRAAAGFRGDDTRQAWDTGTAIPYDRETVETLLAGVESVDDDARARIKRFNATLIAYLFLMYFDTRVGSGDTGPYRLDDGRVLLVRDYYRLGQSDFWWSDVAKDVPYQNLTAALVLDGVDFTITDFGTAKTDPEDYLDHLVGFGLFTTDTPDRSLTSVGSYELDPIMAEVRAAQSAHYRAIAAMDRDEKIRCGAYVYFSFLKQFADEAGIGEELDWSVPRDLPPEWYAFFSAMEGTNTSVEEEGPYYAPYGEDA